MTPAEALGSLDGMIAANGQDVVFITIPDGIEFSCRAFVAAEMVVISATSLKRLGQRASVGNPYVPRRNDKLLINGRRRNIEKVDPIFLDNELIRVNLTTQFDMPALR